MNSLDRILLIFKDHYTAERGLRKLGLKEDDRYRACGYGAGLAGAGFRRIIILNRPTGDIEFLKKCDEWEKQIQCRLVPGGEFVVLA